MSWLWGDSDESREKRAVPRVHGSGDDYGTAVLKTEGERYSHVYSGIMIMMAYKSSKETASSVSTCS